VAGWLSAATCHAIIISFIVPIRQSVVITSGLVGYIFTGILPFLQMVAHNQRDGYLPNKKYFS
jgi:hypothetical protein